MPNAIESPPGKRARLMMMLLAAAGVTFLMLGVRTSQAAACTSGGVCTWYGASYTGGENFLGCPSGTGWEAIIPEQYSAKNRCSGQYIRIGWGEAGVTSWKACMVPGGERPNPGRFNRYERVGGC
jgi:hypothetical protein